MECCRRADSLYIVRLNFKILVTKLKPILVYVVNISSILDQDLRVKHCNDHHLFVSTIS